MDITHFAGVKFNSAGKAYYFGSDIPDLKVGDFVVAESVRGMQVGVIAIEPQEISQYKSELELKPIVRRATEDDLLIYDENIKRAKAAMKIAMIEINNLGLEMRPIDAEYSIDGTKLTIAYVADDRVDFRELLKVLANRFKCRIELRQVGARDKARMVGGIGICGLPLCCSSFLTNMEGISINRAKNQMLSLNIPKLSGQCGKLICCLLYEDDAYSELKQGFPHIGDLYKDGEEVFKVTSFNVLSKVIKLEAAEDIRFVPLDDLKKYEAIKRKWDH